ncbi:MAG: hypothetical protein PHU25_12985 [Deltaproteobacteria bacterium]|nr:hypothetical protein [Deltaproteobacteria bacterium]
MVFGAGEPKEMSLKLRCDACQALARYAPDGAFEQVTVADWMPGYDGEGPGNIYGWGLAAFPDGSSCLALWLECPFVIPSQSGEIALVPEPEGVSDGFLVRFDPQGLARWARRIGGAGEDGAWGVEALPDGSCVVAGWYENAATVEGGGAADVTLDAGEPFGQYAARYGVDGGLDWAIDLDIRQPQEGMGPDGPAKPLVLKNGDLAVAGQFAGKIDLGDGQIAEGTENLPQIYLSRLSATGQKHWAAAAVGPGHRGDVESGARDIAELADGSLVVGGTVNGEKTFGAGEPAETTLVSDGREDGFLAMYEPDGKLVWAFRLGGESVWGATDGVVAVAAVGNDTIYAAGFFAGTPTIGDSPAQSMGISTSGGTEVLLMRLDRNKPPR